MKKTISLTYPRSIYADELFSRAVSDYRDICRVKVSLHDASTVCTFSDSAVDLALTAKEFSNYLIELALSRSDNE